VHAPTVSVLGINTRILAKNDEAAARNRAWFRGREILALNLMSAPGAGKTTLLERTVADLKNRHALYVLEGDQATDNDGQRIKAAGAPAVQINTGQGCHLDAEMLARGLSELKPAAGSVLFIENVGNLVCPALFDLGEARRVAILSVTEGDDKPLKYPHMFRAADLMLLNKIDLLPHVRFDVERAIANARTVNPRIEVIKVSAQTGQGVDRWFEWISAAHNDAAAGMFA
jgi:hydrogenase nickel incorporation protein HypB